MAAMGSMPLSIRTSQKPLKKSLNDKALVAQAMAGCEHALTELWSHHGERARKG